MEQFKVCNNCGQKNDSSYKYCPNCGQKFLPGSWSIFTLIKEWAGVYFLNYDAKIWLTLRALLIPGKLYRDFVDDKRARYMPPVNLLIFSYLTFVLSLQFNNRFSGSNQSNVKAGSIETIPANGSDTSNNGSTNIAFYFHFGNNLKFDAIDSLIHNIDNINASKIDSLIESKKWSISEIIYLKLYKATLDDFQGNLDAYLFDLFNKTYFLFLPLIALIFWLMYPKTFNYYAKALLFSLFIIVYALLTASIAIWGTVLSFLFFVLLFLYVLLSLKAVSGKGIFITLIKTLMIFFLEVIIVIPVIFVFLFIGVLLFY